MAGLSEWSSPLPLLSLSRANGFNPARRDTCGTEIQVAVCVCVSSVCMSVWFGQWVCGILISLNSAVAKSAILSLNKMNDAGL